jgi:hypothetical protein
MKTLKEAIAAHGINAAEAIRNLKRRARYAQSRDRTKVFASTRPADVPGHAYANRNVQTQMRLDLLTLELAGVVVDPHARNKPVVVSTADYVAAWCRLNNLKGYSLTQ